jgi:hypothetical protein
MKGKNWDAKLGVVQSVVEFGSIHFAVSFRPRSNAGFLFGVWG